MSLKAGDWAAWVQAVGSIVAILTGFGTVIYQNRPTERVQEAERELSPIFGDGLKDQAAAVWD